MLLHGAGCTSAVGCLKRTSKELFESDRSCQLRGAGEASKKMAQELAKKIPALEAESETLKEDLEYKLSPEDHLDVEQAQLFRGTGFGFAVNHSSLDVRGMPGARIKGSQNQPPSDKGRHHPPQHPNGIRGRTRH